MEVRSLTLPLVQTAGGAETAPFRTSPMDLHASVATLAVFEGDASSFALTPDRASSSLAASETSGCVIDTAGGGKNGVEKRILSPHLLASVSRALVNSRKGRESHLRRRGGREGSPTIALSSLSISAPA